MASRTKTPQSSKRPKSPVRKISLPAPVPIPGRGKVGTERRVYPKSAKTSRTAETNLSSSVPTKGILKNSKYGSQGTSSSDSENEDEGFTQEFFFSTDLPRRENMHVRFASGTKEDSNNYRQSLPSDDGLDTINWNLVRELRAKIEEEADSPELKKDENDEGDDAGGYDSVGTFKEVENLYLLLRSSKETLYITLLTYEEQLIERAKEILFQNTDETVDGADALKFTEDVEPEAGVDPAAVARNITIVIEKLQPRFDVVMKEVLKKSEGFNKVRSFRDWCRHLAKEVSNVIHPPSSLPSMVQEENFPEFKLNLKD